MTGTNSFLPMKNSRLISALLLLTGLALMAGAAPAAPPAPPNIILIFADDLGWKDVAYNND